MILSLSDTKSPASALIYPYFKQPVAVHRIDGVDPHAEQTKRHALAIEGNCVWGARPIASKLTGVDRRQTGTPWD